MLKKLTFIALFIFCAIAIQAQTSVVFPCTGAAQNWVVPPCVTSIDVIALGAQGGGPNGGLGASVTATIAVTPGQTLQINTGCRCNGTGTSFNGGGAGQTATSAGDPSFCGGGGSDIRIAPYGLANRIIVAAGGGGTGGGTEDALGGDGGCAAGLVGAAPFGLGGAGGTQAAGGAGGAPWQAPGNFGANGALGAGGAGATDPCNNNSPGGGGGGGYYGGGGGGSDCFASAPYGGGGGGGGSSLTPAGGVCTAGVRNGPGEVTITYTAGVGVTTASNTGPYCIGDPIQLNTTGVGTYAWTGPLGFNSAVQNPTIPAATPAMAGVYTVTVTDPGGCVMNDTTTVVIWPDPTANQPANINYCPGETVPASAFGGTPVGVTFSWTNSNPSIGLAANGNGNTPAFTATNATGAPIVGTITVTPTANGCTGTPVNYTITINPTIPATINPAGPFCLGATAINMTSVNPGGTWSGTGITNPATGTFDPLTAGVGNHVVTYGIPGACGDTQTTIVIVTAQLDATINLVGPFCETDPQIILTAVDPGGTWSGTGITNPATGAFDPQTAGSGNHVITYGISGSCGDTQTVNITINPLLNATITPVPTMCVSDPAINLTALDPGGNWSGTGITNPATGTFDPNTAGPGVHTITYAINGSCGDTQTVNITVTLQLNATITPVGPFCETDPSIILTPVDPGGVWSGTGITNTATGAFDPQTAGPGLHTITYGITGACGDTQTVDIQIIQNADATITPVGPYCIVDVPVNLTAVDPGGTWSGTGITNAGAGTFDPNVAGAGVHTITYAIAGQCGDVQTTNITVNAMDDATITPVGPFCVDAPAILLNAVTPGGTWSGTGVTNPASGAFDPQTAGPGTHTISYTTSGVCSSTDTEDIIVNALPTVDFTVDTLSLCAEPVQAFEFYNLSDTTGGMVGTSLWNFGDGSTAMGDTVSQSYSNPGTYDITLTITSTAAAGGCTNSLTKPAYVQVFANPIADFNTDNNPTTVFDPTVSFIDQSVNNIIAWDWNLGGLAMSTEQNPIYTFPEDTGNYLITLFVTDQNGCTDSTSAYVIVRGEYGIFMPNSFTPDFDFLNDGFGPKGYGIADDGYGFYIYDRWGEMVFETHTPFEPWYGGYKGKLVPNGTYVWQLNFNDINGLTHKEVGKVTVVR